MRKEELLFGYSFFALIMALVIYLTFELKKIDARLEATQGYGFTQDIGN